jgi:hypothetical protein
MVAISDSVSRHQWRDDRVSVHGVNTNRDAVEDDPERCSYFPLDPKLDTLVHERFAAAREGAVMRLGGNGVPIGLASTGVSSERTTDGDRWLRFFATDGTSWYMGRTGDSDEALSLAEEFGKSIAETFLSDEASLRRARAWDP